MINQLKNINAINIVIELFNSSILISAITVFSHIGGWMSYLLAVLLYITIQLVLTICTMTTLLQLTITALTAFTMLLLVIGTMTTKIEFLFYIIALILGFVLSIYFKLRKLSL